MTLVFTLGGLLLVVSGIVKIVGARRAGLGVPPLSLLEVVAGLALPFFGLSRSPGAGLRLLQAAIALLLVSTLSHGLKVRGMRLRRAESEGRRLLTYVKYLSPTGDPPNRES